VLHNFDCVSDFPAFLPLFALVLGPVYLNSHITVYMDAINLKLRKFCDGVIKQVGMHIRSLILNAEKL
jgi:hypothetical protein